MTGVLKIPLLVGNVQARPPSSDGVTGERPSWRLVRRNFGHGLVGSSATSYWNGARVARSLRRAGLPFATVTTPRSVSHGLRLRSARSFTLPGTPAHDVHAARTIVPRRFVR